MYTLPTVPTPIFHIVHMLNTIRDRPTQELEFFFQNLTLGYMTKTLNQIFFFSSTKIRIFFQQHWESEYFFRKKTIASSVKNGDTILIRLNIHVALHLFLWPILTPCKAPC